jgi:hypothetical protein
MYIKYDWRSVSQQVLVSSPIWGSGLDIYYCSTVTVLFFWCTLSDQRTDLSSVYAAGSWHRSAIFLGSESLGTRDLILLSQIWDFRVEILNSGRAAEKTPPPIVSPLLACFTRVYMYIPSIIARQRLVKHVSGATNTGVTKELLVALFLMLSVSY